MLFPAGAGIVKEVGGRVPVQNVTDETAALTLAFLGYLLSISFASQFPRSSSLAASDGPPRPSRVR